MATELLYLVDAYLKEFDAKVVEVRENAVALDRTIFIRLVVVNLTTQVRSLARA